MMAWIETTKAMPLAILVSLKFELRYSFQLQVCSNIDETVLS